MTGQKQKTRKKIIKHVYTSRNHRLNIIISGAPGVSIYIRPPPGRAPSIYLILRKITNLVDYGLQRLNLGVTPVFLLRLPARPARPALPPFPPFRPSALPPFCKLIN